MGARGEIHHSSIISQQDRRAESILMEICSVVMCEATKLRKKKRRRRRRTRRRRTRRRRKELSQQEPVTAFFSVEKRSETYYEGVAGGQQVCAHGLSY